MTIVADRCTHVMGVDTHAKTHTYAIVQAATGAVVAAATFPVTPAGLDRALAWAQRRAPGYVAAVEGTASYGATLTARLQQAGTVVFEARPPKRASRAGRGKSDQIDAVAAARSVLSEPLERLATPRSGELRRALQLLLTARRLLERQRAQDHNALTAIVRRIELGIDARKALTDRQVEQIAAWRTRTTDSIAQAIARAEATRLARQSRLRAAELKDNKAMLERHVRTLAPELLEEVGIGPVSAAACIAAYSHHGRVRSEAAFASLAGVAPIPASSGNTQRHRLNRHGDRRLNAALDTIVRTRLRSDPTTRAYRDQHLAEGKTNADIRRLLKRYTARSTYRTLKKILNNT
ncbi:IS110 family RNA-guided transposase [Agrococcus carbonis]|uniref:Transposase n=1 Tax=Agrococcus carbonis TaxID=684552 RepID=A0A1H1P709_9MICO|nr:IS110 family transposase [Agrococcus carbonis]SDS06765.1 Transposase [Agrococcus carbonis]